MLGARSLISCLLPRRISFVAIALCFAIALVYAPAAAFAQGDPNEEELSFNVTIPTLFRISAIDNFTFGSYSGTGSFTRSDDLCVWTNAASGRYRVNARGSGASFAYLIAKNDDAARTIPFTVEWITTSGTTSLSPDTNSADLDGANTTSSSCSTAPATPATVRVTFAQSDLLGVPHGSYAGTLTLIISPPLSP